MQLTPKLLYDVELGMVLGGDGSVCAAEMVRESNLPLMAVNLGHVGFLAEAEQADLELPSRRWSIRITSLKNVWPLT